LEDSLTPANPAAPAAAPKKDAYTPDLPALKRMFEDARALTYDSRRESQIDQDYYDGYQWTAEERLALKGRKQPDLVFNRVRPAINGTLGVIKQGATDPRAYPRTPQDEDSADVVSKTLRFIADKNSLDDRKIDISRNYLVPGTTAAIVEVDEDRQIIITEVRFEEFFYDPRSRRADFKDARYMGIAKWLYVDDLVREYPDQKGELERSLDAGAPISLDEMQEDRPKDAQTAWADKKKRRVMAVEIYHSEGGKWYRCKFHAGGVLEGAESPYADDKGRPCNPIEAQSCFVDRENNRYGLVRDMRGPQDQINKSRSKIQHILNTRAVQESQPGSGMGDADVVRTEAARPDAVLPSGWQFLPMTSELQGHIEVLQMSIQEIERMAPNPAILGRQGESQSGRASLIRQQAGLTEQAIIFGGIEDLEVRIYRQCWNRARQYWQAPMFVRVTDDEGSPQFVGVNQPVMGPPQIVQDPQTGMTSLQPQVLGYKNRLAELDVDIILDTVPDTANVQQEQFDVLAELAKVYPQDVTFDDLLKLSKLQGKREVMENRKARQEQASQTQQGNPQTQLALRGAVAKISETEGKASKAHADAALSEVRAHNELMTPRTEAAALALQANQTPPPGATGVPQAGA
jgi:hypothetical protein